VSHVLLLDDNLMSSEPLRRALTNAGNTCEILSALPDDLSGYDCLAINLGSPRLDGPAIIQHAKVARPDLLVTGFCGHAETELREAARAAGVDRLVTHSAMHRDPLVLLAD